MGSFIKELLSKYSGNRLSFEDHQKQRIISEIQDKYGSKIFVTIGDHLNDLAVAQKARFDRTVSIMHDEKLCLKARKKLSSNDNTIIVLGECCQALALVLETINQPAIFWIDGSETADIATEDGDAMIVSNIIEAIKCNLNTPYIVLIDAMNGFNLSDDNYILQQINYSQSSPLEGGVFEIASRG